MRAYLKPILAGAILTLTIVLFVRYVQTHPEVIAQLRSLHPSLVLVILLGYGLFFGALALVTRYSLQLYGKTIGPQENLLFNAYSMLVNFFGPGQSGPAFRGVYLKKRHQLPIKHYLFATLLYYGCYAAISGLMVILGSRPWWNALLAAAAGAGLSLLVLRWYMHRSHIAGALLHWRAAGWIALATLLQLLAQLMVFWIQLNHVQPGVSFGHVLAYTGTANFALFVAITPGAIGIREAFLSFTTSLHHLSQQAIVSANIIDRGVFLLFLGVLFALVIGLHAKKKLHL